MVLLPPVNPGSVPPPNGTTSGTGPHYKGPTNKPGGAGYQGLPIDSEGREELAQAAAARLNYINTLQQQRHSTEHQYTQSLQGYTVQHPLDVDTLQNQDAAAGTGFSTSAVNDQDLLHQKYATILSNLRQNNRDTLAGFRQQRQGYGGQYRADVAAIQGAAAQRVAANHAAATGG